MPPKTNQVASEAADQNADALIALRAAGQDSLDHCPPEGLVYGKTVRRWKKELAPEDLRGPAKR